MHSAILVMARRPAVEIGIFGRFGGSFFCQHRWVKWPQPPNSSTTLQYFKSLSKIWRYFSWKRKPEKHKTPTPSQRTDAQTEWLPWRCPNNTPLPIAADQSSYGLAGRRCFLFFSHLNFYFYLLFQHICYISLFSTVTVCSICSRCDVKCSCLVHRCAKAQRFKGRTWSVWLFD